MINLKKKEWNTQNICMQNQNVCTYYCNKVCMNYFVFKELICVRSIWDEWNHANKNRGIYIKWLPQRIVGNGLWLCSKERVYELYKNLLEKQVL